MQTLSTFIAMGIASIPTLTTPPQPPILHEYLYDGEVRGSYSPFSSDAISGSTSLLVVAPDVRLNFDRQTTPLEKLEASFRQWVALGENWDGEGASEPNLESLNRAADFVSLLEVGMPLPEAMLHSNGRAGLFWNNNNYYGEIEFLENNKLAYFFEINGDKHKGVVTFDQVEMPVVLKALI